LRKKKKAQNEAVSPVLRLRRDGKERRSLDRKGKQGEGE